METRVLALSLTILGISGLLIFALVATKIFWTFRGCTEASFLWHLRNYYLKQLVALTCLFCLAMAASYAILLEVWTIFYLIVAFKIGTWWLRLAYVQRM